MSFLPLSTSRLTVCMCFPSQADTVEELQRLVEESQQQRKATEDRLHAKDETIRRLQELVDSPTTTTTGMSTPFYHHHHHEPETHAKNSSYIEAVLHGTRLSSGAEDEQPRMAYPLPVFGIGDSSSLVGSFFTPHKYNNEQNSFDARENQVNVTAGLGTSVCPSVSCTMPQTSFTINCAKYINSGRKHRLFAPPSSPQVSLEDQPTTTYTPAVNHTSLPIEPVDSVAVPPLVIIDSQIEQPSMSFADFLPDQTLSQNNSTSPDRNLKLLSISMSPFTKILDDPLSGRKYTSRGPVIMQTKSSLLRMQSFQCSNQVPSKVSPSPKKKNGYNTRSMLKKVVPISSFKLEEEDSAQDRKKKRKLRRSHITKKLNWDGRLLRKSKKLSAGAASASAGADACGKSKGKGVAAFVEKKKDGFMKVFNRL